MANDRNQGRGDPRIGLYSQGRESGIVRFCFAKKDETLRHALERLARL